MLFVGNKEAQDGSVVSIGYPVRRCRAWSFKTGVGLLFAIFVLFWGSGIRGEPEGRCGIYSVGYFPNLASSGLFLPTPTPALDINV